MYGWRCRIGYVGVPGVSVPLYDMWRFAPPGVTTVTSTLSGDAGAPLEHQLLEAATELKDYDVDTVLVSSRIWPGGVGFETRHAGLQGLADLVGCEVHLDVAAGLDFLRESNADSVLVVQASRGDEDELEGRHLERLIESGGWRVGRMTTEATTGTAVDRELGHAEIVAAVGRSNDPAAALLLWPPESYTHDLESLESELEVPIVSVAAAGVWLGLRSARYPVELGGRLTRLKKVFGQETVDPVRDRWNRV
jgi:hypothetical protein